MYILARIESMYSDIRSKNFKFPAALMKINCGAFIQLQKALILMC